MGGLPYASGMKAWAPGVVCSWQQTALSLSEWGSCHLEKKENKCFKAHLSLISERQGALGPHLSDMEGILIVMNCIRLTLSVQNDGDRKPRDR